MPRRTAVVLAATLGLILIGGPGAFADHVPPGVGSPAGLPADVPALTVGDWRFVKNFPAGPGPDPPLGVDWEPFTRDGRRYVVGSSMTMGLTVFDVTDPLAPQRVADYASAFGCPQADPLYLADRAAAGDVSGGVLIDATFGATSGWENDLTITPDGKVAIIGTDAPGRCHDPEGGGIELVDLSDVTRPRLIHLVRTHGMAHSITVDPARPWLAYTSTSDGDNHIDIVDFRTCLGGADARDACRPSVARAVFQDAWTKGIVDKNSYGCHDIRFRGNRAYCAALAASIILDVSGVLNASGKFTGTDLAAPGFANACPIIDADPLTAPGAKVTDCSGWTGEAFGERGAKSVQIRLVSAVHHGGPGTPKPPDQDVEVSHQAEAIADGKIMIVTDERGGGLNAEPGVCPGGGIWFYNITDERNPRLMTQPDGSAAVFLTKNVFQTNANCTVHYGTQFERESLLVFAWYTQGTHVIRYTPDFAENEIAFDEVAAYIPTAASTWTSMGLVRNPQDPDELVVFTTDIMRGFDVLTVHVPKQAPTPKPGTSVRGARVTRGRPLPETGVADPAAPGALLVAIAAALAIWRKRTGRAVT